MEKIRCKHSHTHQCFWPSRSFFTCCLHALQLNMAHDCSRTLTVTYSSEIFHTDSCFCEHGPLALHPKIRRLDYMTEGLLLLTNNGELKRFLELPANAIPREYHVRLYAPPSAPITRAALDSLGTSFFSTPLHPPSSPLPAGCRVAPYPHLAPAP